MLVFYEVNTLKFLKANCIQLSFPTIHFLQQQILSFVLYVSLICSFRLSTYIESHCKVLCNFVFLVKVYQSYSLIKNVFSFLKSR